MRRPRAEEQASELWHELDRPSEGSFDAKTDRDRTDVNPSVLGDRFNGGQRNGDLLAEVRYVQHPFVHTNALQSSTTPQYEQRAADPGSKELPSPIVRKT